MDIKPDLGLPLEKLSPSIVPLLTVFTVGTRGIIIPAISDYPLCGFFVFVALPSRGQREPCAGVDTKHHRPKIPLGCVVQPVSFSDVQTAGRISLYTPATEAVNILIFKTGRWTNAKVQQFRSPRKMKRSFTMSRNFLNPPSSLPYPRYSSTREPTTLAASLS